MASTFGEFKQYVDEKIRQAVSRIIQFTYYSRSSASGGEDNVECDHTDQKTPSYTVRRMQHYGFRSVPPKGVAVLRYAAPYAASNGVTFAEESAKFGPSDLADSDVCVYGATSGQIVKCHANGKITIANGSGCTVVLDGTTATVDATTVTVTATGTATVTGASVKLGPVGTLGVLVVGTLDSMGIPVTQAVAASGTVVKAG